MIKTHGNKAVGCKMASGISGDGDTFACTITAETIDRDGEVVMADGCDITHYNKAVLFEHDHTKLIGVCQAITRVPGPPKSLQAVIRLMPEQDATIEARTVRNIIKQAVPLGLTPGFSIGFIRREARAANDRDRKQYGGECVMVTSKSELLEISITLVQCNREALLAGVGKGYYSREGLLSLGLPVEPIKRTIIVPAWRPTKKARKPAGMRIEEIVRRELQKYICN